MRALRQGAARALAATALLGVAAVAAGCGSSAPAAAVPFTGAEATVRAA